MKYTRLTLTFKQYDELIERLEKIKSPAVWPTLHIIDKKAVMTKDNPEEFKKWVLYCCFVSEKGVVKNKTDEYSKKNVNRFLREALNLVDDISFTHPEIAAEWHPEKNVLTPEDVHADSPQIVWRKNQNGDEWEESVANRIQRFESEGHLN